MNSNLPGGIIATALFPKLGRRAVLLCGGVQPPREVLATWLAGADLFACTDAAGIPYDELPLRPDLIIGDFDSIEQLPPPEEWDKRYIRKPDQLTTDAEKALTHLRAEGIDEVVLLGTRGGRLDHSVHNLSLPERFSKQMRICIADEWGISVRLEPKVRHHFDLPREALFSLLPLAGAARGVNIGGAQYPLTDAELSFGGGASISNRVAAKPLRIDIGSGSLILSVALAEHQPGKGERKA